jgi:hypothetical protein
VSNFIENAANPVRQFETDPEDSALEIQKARCRTSGAGSMIFAMMSVCR